MDIINVVIQHREDMPDTFRLVANVKDENGIDSTLIIDEPDQATQEAIDVIISKLS